MAKAEADYRGALALKRLRRDPVPELVCFHAQQCAEKYLKALLQSHGSAPPRTHDLDELTARLTPTTSHVMRLAGDSASLTEYGVDVRYPGQSATPDEAKHAVAAMRRIRRFARRGLGIGR